jgi:hypothetical protein
MRMYIYILIFKISKNLKAIITFMLHYNINIYFLNISRVWFVSHNKQTTHEKYKKYIKNI